MNKAEAHLYCGFIERFCVFFPIISLIGKISKFDVFSFTGEFTPAVSLSQPTAPPAGQTGQNRRDTRLMSYLSKELYQTSDSPLGFHLL